MAQMCFYRYDTKQCYLEKFGKFSASTKTLNPLEKTFLNFNSYHVIPFVSLYHDHYGKYV